MGRVARMAVVRGAVQGVGFRMNARAEAQRLGVVGRASNLPDGTVEVVVEGEDDAVNALIAWLRVGPRFATVDSVEVSESEPVGLRGFEVR